MRQVYIIRVGVGGPVVKIGVCHRVVSRMSTLQTMNFEPLYLLRSWDGDLFEETQLHRYFAPLRLRGEWFSYSDEMATVQLRDVIRRNLGHDLHPGELPIEDDAAGITEAAAKVGLTMTHLARAAGISPSLISKWKKGERPIGGERRCAMIDAIHKQYAHLRPASAVAA